MNLPNSNVASHFWNNALTRGAAPALWNRDEARFLTWAELAQIVVQTCNWLRGLGLEPASRLATQWPNSLEWIVVDLACQTLGLIHLPIDAREPPETVRQLVERADAFQIDRLPEAAMQPPIGSCDRKAFPPVPLASRAPAAEDIAQLLSTSGTTGQAKLVALTHRNLIANAWQKLDAAPQYEEDLRLNLLPFSHAYARTCELSAWIVSGSQLAIARDWEDFLVLGELLHPTLVNLVPYLAKSFATLEAPVQSRLGSRLRLLQVGGAPLHDQLWEHLASLGWPPLQGYGLTEASPVVCSNRAGQQRPGTVGPAVAGTQLRIDEQGLLWLRGPQVMAGYWNDSVATAEVLQNGWLCTGDLAEESPRGIRIVGRQSQLLVLSTGYKVSPELVESRLLALEDVEQALVTGDGCPHITAWLWPSVQHLPREFAASTNSSQSRPLVQRQDIAGADLQDSELAPSGARRGLQASRGVGEIVGHSTVNLQARTFLWDTDGWLRSVIARVAASCHDLPPHAIPRDLRILPQPLSIAAGTLTRKGGPNRAAPPPGDTA